MSRGSSKPQKPSHAGKRQSKLVENIEVTFQDETANFKLPAESFQRSDPKVAPPNLAFVNLTGSSGPTQDAGKRKLVRAHVMREFQREKQEKEQKAFEQWKAQTQRDSKQLVPSLQQIPHPDATEWDEDEDEENQVEVTYRGFQWSANLPYQPRDEPSVLSQQIREWTPGFIVPTEDDDTAMGNMSFESNEAFKLPLTAVPNQLYTFPELFDQEDEEPSEAMMTEQVECPLISNSIKSMTRDSASFNALDPFDSMPGLRNSRAQAIIYHYNKILMPTLIAVVDPEERWFNYAITDPALFHGTMLHSAAHNSLLSGNTDLADPIQIKWEATRLVNQRLGDPVLSISDVTMGAVVCLVLFEHQSGNVELSNIHMNGLRRMVNLRGGIQNLGLAGILKRKILWADLCNATLTHSKPQFNLEFDMTYYRNRISDSSFISRTPSPTTSASCSCGKALAEITNSLCSLSNIVSTKRQPKALISDEVYLVERRVVVLLAQNDDIHHFQTCQSVSQPAFIACLIYIYAFLRDFPLRSPLFGNLVERLSAILFDREEDRRIGCWSENSYPLLLWVLVIGALVSEERCKRDRFVGELKRICEVLGVNRFEDFEAGLKNNAWLEQKALESTIRATPFLRTLWSEIQLVGIGVEVDVNMTGAMDLMRGF